MVKMTSLTELEIRLISFFIGHITEQFAIRELARKAHIDYKLVHATVQKLAQKNIILKKRQANVDLCSLNLRGDLPPLYYAEMLRTKEFLQKHKELKLFFNDATEKAKKLYYTLAVFGSFAKNTETPQSDVDILIIAPTRETGEEIGRIVTSQAIILKRKVQPIVLDEKEFISNLASKEPNAVVEAFKNHIIITGIEAFYKGVVQAR